VPIVAALLVLASAAIVLTLGLIHLWYTFRGNNLEPRDAGLLQSMKQVHPVLTRRTTMWRAWVGFNATHSLGLLVFAVVYGYLALAAPRLLFNSGFLGVVGLVALLAYTFVAHSYFFKTPFRGVLLATALYTAGLIVMIF
jgi:hypothetical protein